MSMRLLLAILLGAGSLSAQSVVSTVVPKSDAAAETKRLTALGWKAMPADRLQALVGDAQGRALGAKSIVRLVQAHYACELQGTALVNGSASWLLQPERGNAGLLPLAQWNLALKNPAWDGAADVPVLLGQLDGKDLGLWVDGGAEKRLGFGWSLRGIPGPQATRFVFQTPAPLALSLDIRMPSEFQLVVLSGGMLAGPIPIAQSTDQLWQLRATARGQFEFLVRKISNDAAPATLLAVIDSEQTLTPDHLQTDFDVQVDILHHPVRELTLQLERGMRALDVSVRLADLKTWTFLEETKETPPSVTVSFLKPMQGTLGLRLRAQLPFTGDAVSAPRLRVEGAVLRSEGLKLLLPADLPLLFWDAGDLRLMDASADKLGNQTLTLVDPAPQAESKRPRLLLKSQGLELATTQTTRWQLRPHETTLASEIQYELARGSMFQLKLLLRLPKTGTWRVASVKSLPDGVTLPWGLVENLLVVDVKKGVNPRSDFKLLVNLECPWQFADEAPRFYELPELEPEGVQQRKTSLAVHVHPLFGAGLVPNSANSAPTDPGTEGPATLFFEYRNQRLTGTLRVVPHSAQYGVRLQEKAKLTRQGCQVRASITVEPTLGSPTFVDLWVSGVGLTSPRIVDAKGVTPRGVERQFRLEIPPALAALAFADPLGQAAYHALAPTGQAWRIVFQEPLTKPAVVDLEFTHVPLAQRVPMPMRSWLFALQPPGLQSICPPTGVVERSTEQTWQVPLVTFPRAERFHGELLVQTEGMTLRDLRWQGLESPAAIAKEAPTAVRLLRFGSWSLSENPFVLAATRLEPVAAADSATLDLVRLASFLDVQGRVFHHLSASLWNWKQSDVAFTFSGDLGRVLGVRRNGVWIDQWAVSADADKQRLSIPLVFDQPVQQLEIVYMPKERLTFGLFGAQAAALMPELPARPIQVQYRWFLAPGLMPLYQERFGSIYQHAPGMQIWREAWNAGIGFVDLFRDEPPTEFLERQNNLMLSAEATLRAQIKSEQTLGDWFQQLIFQGLKEKTPLVLDRQALRQLGWTPGRLVRLPADNQPFWESLGFKLVTTPGGPLLTSKSREKGWKSALAGDPFFPHRLSDMVLEAAQSGQDRTGQFCAVDYWLRNETEGADLLSQLPPFLEDIVGEGWTEWQPGPGESQPARLHLVSVLHLRWLSLGLAGMIFLSGWRMRRYDPAWQFRILALLVLANAAILSLVPLSLREFCTWPLAACIGLLVLWYFFVRWNPPVTPSVRPSRSTHKIAKQALAGLALVGSALVIAQEPQAVFNVAYFPAVRQEPAQAFVDPDFLAHLEKAAAAPPAQLRDVVFLKADYQGVWKGTFAEWTANFEFHVFQDEALVQLPLVGVELQDATLLDKVRVLPTVIPGKDFAGYQFPVQGRGPHHLRCVFLVEPKSTGDFQELRCQIPSVAQTTVAGKFPAAWQNLHVHAALGEASIRTVGKTLKEVSAEVGKESTLHLRWRSEAPSVKSSVDVRELYFADVRVGQASLYAMLGCQTNKASLPHLELNLGDKTEVRSVQLLVDKTSVPLSTWRMVSGAVRRLRIDLPDGTSGKFQLLVEMSVRLAEAGKVDLRLPQPVFVNLQKSMLAVRSEAPETSLALTDLSSTQEDPKKFLDEIPEVWRKLFAAPKSAYSFGRKSAQAGIKLELPATLPALSLEMRYSVAPAAIDLAGVVSWTAADKVGLLQLEVPTTVLLTDVRAVGDSPTVHHWARHKNLVQIWLQKSASQGAVELLGWLKPIPGKDYRFAAPVVSAPGSRLAGVKLSVRAGADLQLLPETRKNKNVKILDSDLRRRDVELGVLKTWDFSFEREKRLPEVQMLTRVDWHEGRASWQTRAVAYHPLGQFAGMKLIIRNFPYRLKAPTGEHLLVKGYQRQGDDHIWTLDVKPQVGANQLAFRLGGRWPKGTPAPLALPIVVTQGTKNAPAWFTLEGAAWTSEDRVESVSNHPALRTEAWAGVAPPASAIWQARDTGVLSVQPLTRLAVSPVQIAQAKTWTLLGQPGEWAHVIEWQLLAKESPEISIRLPPGAILAKLMLDDQPTAPILTGDDVIGVSIPETPTCRLRLFWRYPRGAESLLAPRLETPTLIGIAAPPAQGVFLRPAGLELAGGKSMSAVQSLLADVQAAQARLAWLAAEEGANTPAAREVYALGARALRFAEYRQAFGSNAQEVLKARKAWSEIEPPRGETSPAEARQTLRLRALGSPAYWSSADPAPGIVPERESAVPVIAPIYRESAALILACLVILSFLPTGLRWLVATWPEQMVLAALMAAAMGGVTLMAGIAVALALVGRAWLLLRGIENLWTRWRSPPEP